MIIVSYVLYPYFPNEKKCTYQFSNEKMQQFKILINYINDVLLFQNLSWFYKAINNISLNVKQKKYIDSGINNQRIIIVL